jgi:hypothetical protein
VPGSAAAIPGLAHERVIEKNSSHAQSEDAVYLLQRGFESTVSMLVWAVDIVDASHSTPQEAAGHQIDSATFFF